MNQLFQAIFQQHRAMGWVAIAEVMSKVTLFGSTVSVIYLFQAGLLSILAAIVLAGGVQTLILWLASRRYVQLHAAFELPVWKRIMGKLASTAIALNLIYFKSDTIILVSTISNYRWYLWWAL